MDTKENIIKVNTDEYNFVIKKLMEFCFNKGFVYGCYQQNPTILAACEQPENIMPYQFNGKTWPMVQTNQMQLECVLLDNPTKHKGIFTTTTSYRNEQEMIPGRHSKVFPMFEFEFPGDFDDLKVFCRELLIHLGFKDENIQEVNYEDACKRFNTDEIEHEHEMQMCKDNNGPIMLTMFPERTHPFWNMSRNDEGYSYKLDVIINRETFGTAERSCSTTQMMDSFQNISDGKYAETLYNHFGKERVDEELNTFLEYNFVNRVGGGIGITRLISGLKEFGLMPNFE